MTSSHLITVFRGPALADHGRGGFRSVQVSDPQEYIDELYCGSFKAIARMKRFDMHMEGFEDMLDKFPKTFGCVKPLCRKVRRIYFPRIQQIMFTRTPLDPRTGTSLSLKRLIRL